MDIWLEPSETNRAKFILFLTSVGFDDESISYFNNVNLNVPNTFHIGEVPNRIDFLTHLSGIAYSAADKRKIWGEMEELKIPVLHMDDVIINKLQSNRLKDK